MSLDPMYHLVKALELEPQNPEITHLQAKLLLDQGKEHSAVALIQSFLTKFGNNPDLHNLLALAYLRTGSIEQAEESINLALSHSPRSKAVLYTAFLIKKAKGDRFSAYHFLERIIRYDDQSFEIYWEMSQLIDHKAEAQKKINLLEICYTLNPKNLNIFKELMTCYCDWFEVNPQKSDLPPSTKTFLDHSNSPLFAKLSSGSQKRIMSILNYITQ
jgi:tetratricopeptide (TPR) repeat protein